MDGELLPGLRALSQKQRQDLHALTVTTYAAIDFMNAMDDYGKSCCWLGRGDKPETVLEQLVQHVAAHDQLMREDLKDVAGYEWWLQKRKPREGMPFHHDTNWNDIESGEAEQLHFSLCVACQHLHLMGPA